MRSSPWFGRAAILAPCLAVAALACIAPRAAAGADPRPPLGRVERVVYRCPASGETLRVIATVLKELSGNPWGEAVETARIVDRLGRGRFADSLHPSLMPDGSLDWGSDVTALPIQWDSAPGLRLEVRFSPGDYPPHPPDCRFFVLRGRRLVPVTPWCSSTVGPEPGNLIHFKSWLDYFFVRVPARVLLERPEGGVELVADRDAAAGGLARLAIADVPERRFYDENHQRVMDPNARLRVKLYHAPIGEAADYDFLTPSSPVTVGDVYADLKLKRVENPFLGHYVDAAVQIRRLEVTIDGRYGFIELQDFTGIGLYEL